MRTRFAIAATGLAAAALAWTVVLPDHFAAADRRQPTIEDVAVDNEGALSHFRKALEALEAGERERVRIVHWGDSNVAAAVWAMTARDALQERFGDGGPGYLVPRFGTHDYDGLMHASEHWKARRRGFDADYGPRDGRWGLAGVAAAGRGRKAWVQIDTPELAGGGYFATHALRKPHGGSLEVQIDGTEPDHVDTSGKSHGLVRRTWDLEPGEHEVEVRVDSWRPVRLLGVVLEHDRPGLVWDVLGINGHRAVAILDWKKALLRAQLRHRQPDLVVLSYGGNEALDPNVSPGRFAKQLDRALARVETLAPDASVLVVGPVAMCLTRPPLTKLDPRPAIGKVIAQQRKIALENGAAFWDSSGVMGGPKKLCHWKLGDPPLVSADNLHLSREGYEVVGRKFAHALEGAL